MIQKY